MIFRLADRDFLLSLWLIDAFCTMKRIWNILLVVVALLSVASVEAQNTQSDKRVRLADPFILLDNGTYYAYGTHYRHGIEYYISNDLKKWYYGGVALHKNNSYGEKWFWAPEVHLVDGVYYMLYTAQERTCVATSSSPTGPFVQRELKPMIDGYKNIDNTLFIDDDGTPYMFFVQVGKPFKICVAELERDLQSVKAGTITTCITPTQSWERKAGLVNEGPSVIKHKGIYYMLYSGNGYKSKQYGIGFATAKSIRGPWKKSTSNPIFQFPGDLVGVGHGAPFYDKKGNLNYVFHAHYNNEKIHPRCMYISRMSFKRKKRSNIVTISDNYLTPTFEK